MVSRGYPAADSHASREPAGRRGRRARPRPASPAASHPGGHARRQVLVADAAHDTLQRRRLERVPHEEALLDLGVRETADVSPLVGREGHQPLGSQREESLPDRRAAGAQLSAEFGFDQARSGGEGTVQNEVPKMPIDRILHGHPRRERRNHGRRNSGSHGRDRHNVRNMMREMIGHSPPCRQGPFIAEESLLHMVPELDRIGSAGSWVD